MKLNPKIATFCPGCNHNKIEIGKAPDLIINAPQKEPSKRITILGGKNKKSKTGLF